MTDFKAQYAAALTACPAAGSGVHAWVMQVANYAFFAGIDPATAEAEIAGAMSRAPNPRSEVADAVKKAAADHPNWVPQERYREGERPAAPVAPPPPKAEIELLPEVAKGLIASAPEGIGGKDLRALSPVAVAGDGREMALLLIRQLYDADEILFAGERYERGVAQRCDLEERFEAGRLAPFIIPNPVDGEEHDTANGKPSRRCDEAVARHAYAVAEMDGMPLADQFRFWTAWRNTPALQGNLPIAAIVFSGKKSLHAWLRVDAESRGEWKRQVYGELFGKILIPLGCDRTCRNASRLSRLPGFVREGTLQELYYLDPVAEPAHPTWPLAARVKAAAEYVAGLKGKGAGDGKKKPESAEAPRGRGRPRVDTMAIANAFFSSLGDPLPLRVWREGWYRWMGGRYRGRAESSVFSEVITYLRANFPKHASASCVKAVLDHARAADLCAVPEDFLMPCWLPDGKPAPALWAMKNTIVDIEAAARGEPATRPFTPDLFSRLGVDYEYDPAATCPRWEQFLEEVFPDDPEERTMLQLMFGLMLVQDTSYDVIFFLFGDGGTGKTVVAETLESLLGEDNVSHLDVVDLDEKHAQHLMSETLTNITSEIPARLNSLDLSNAEAQIKRAASGEKIKVERKNKDPYFAPATARMVFVTNSLPMFSDMSGGLWRRVRLIPFTVVQVDRPTTDLNLSEKLKAERPGILNWAIKGLGRLRTDYKAFPQLGRGGGILAEHREACDVERTFLEEFYKVQVGGYVPSSELYTAYRGWAERNGYKPKGANRFAQDVRRVYPGAAYSHRRIAGITTRLWENIAHVVEIDDEGRPIVVTPI